MANNMKVITETMSKLTDVPGKTMEVWKNSFVIYEITFWKLLPNIKTFYNFMHVGGKTRYKIKNIYI